MFEGVKVLSFTHFLQGPSTVQMLADLGADVVKIEPLKGAWERQWSGFDCFIDGESVFFLLGNRNQRSLSIDLRAEPSKAIVFRLVERADVLVENYRPGAMQRLGFGYEALKEINPRLIYCSCTGYGSEGPYADRPGQDLLVQAVSGLTTLSGERDSPPTPVGTAIVDQHGAALAAFGLAAALFQRERTGKGCRIESNLLNAALDLQIEPFTYFLNKGQLWDRSKPGMGSRFHPAPYGIYKTSDGWIAVSLTSSEKMARALGVARLAEFSVKDQVNRRDEVHALVCEAIRSRTTEEWYAVFGQHGIWHAPVNDYPQVERDAQVASNRMIMEVDHPDIGKLRLLAHPVRYDGQAPAVRLRPPRLGEHTIEVLKECGFEETEIDRLLNGHIVGASR